MMKTVRKGNLLRNLAYPLGALLTTCGLLTLIVFVVVECLHASALVGSVTQVLMASVGGIGLVVLGFVLMVAASSETREAKTSRIERYLRSARRKRAKK